jgi:hypothetical protein
MQQGIYTKVNPKEGEIYAKVCFSLRPHKMTVIVGHMVQSTYINKGGNPPKGEGNMIMNNETLKKPKNR